MYAMNSNSEMLAAAALVVIGIVVLLTFVVSGLMFVWSGNILAGKIAATCLIIKWGFGNSKKSKEN